MDPLATTNMLEYPAHTIEQQNGIGQKDYTTVWDWLETPKSKGFGLKQYPVKHKGRREPIVEKLKFGTLISDKLIPESRKAVPHRGMKTEKQAAYGVPVQMKVIVFKI